jgi:putative addiction module component (TIGR02574 family)
MKLPAEDRLELADELFESVPDQVENREWQREWAEELQRRVNDIRAGKVGGIDSEKVFAEELQRLDSAGE